MLDNNTRHQKEITGLKEKTTYTIFVKVKDINNLQSINPGRIVITTDAIPRPIITYDSQGGSVCNPASWIGLTETTYGLNIPNGKLCEPTRSGYAFTGWYTEKTGGAKIELQTPLVETVNHSIYAHWTPNSYTVKYVGNGNNSGSMGTTTCTYDSNCTLQGNAFGKTGHSFNNWTGNNGKSYTNAQTFKYDIAGDLTLTAQWKANEYTITYLGNGNNSGAMGTTTCTYNSNCTLGENAFGKYGHYFGYWYGSNGRTYTNAQTFIYDIASNLTLSAQWYVNNFTLFYDNNGGSGCASKQITYGGTYGYLCEPSKTGYTFAGWYTAASGGSAVSAATQLTVADNQTIYAHWTANTYTLTYKPNGGVDCNPKTKSVTFGKKYGTLCTPTRTGYNFNGWYTAKSGGSKVESSTKVTTAGNHTIYAHWTAKPIWIYYNANGGSITTASSKLGFSVRKSDSQILQNGEEYHNKPVNYGETINLSNYNNSGFIELQKTDKLVKSGEEWNTKWKSNEVKAGTIFSQSDDISYANLKNASISQNGNQDNQDHYKLNLYVYWRTCGNWSYSYSCRCFCSQSSETPSGPFYGNWSTCSLLCRNKGYTGKPSGSCSLDSQTCTLYN